MEFTPISVLLTATAFGIAMLGVCLIREQNGSVGLTTAAIEASVPPLLWRRGRLPIACGCRAAVLLNLLFQF